MTTKHEHDILSLIRVARDYEAQPNVAPDIKIAIVTNFTDDLLKKLLIGMSVSVGIHPAVYQVPFKQYIFELKDPESKLANHKPDITFIFFDSNAYIHSDFVADSKHGDDVIDDIKSFAERVGGTIVVHTLSTASSRQHRRLLKENALSTAAQSFNTALSELATQTKNIYILNTDNLFKGIGERHARDLRSLYAFSQPFTHAFLLSVATEWTAYVKILRGQVRKCLVLDLDNVLWGGIVGEVGPRGIALGHEYPGNAYREFQRAIIELYDRGIILAINSRNNEADVEEVFEKNPHMLLKKEHFAAVRINWEPKTDNIRSLAKELNIGLDSMVFIDDDPVNRAAVEAELPEVYVPHWTLAPEEYTHALLELDAFHALRITDEDRARGAMYQQEAKRNALASSAKTPEEYLASLGIAIDVSVNDDVFIPRVAQLTQKTNQYNLSTYRASEEELRTWIAEGALVYAGDVRDSFGAYGLTVVAICKPVSNKEAKRGITLHTYLMSCRVAGRHVEDAFFYWMLGELKKSGFETLRASYIPTLKNVPVKDFLPSLGAKEVEKKKDGEIIYEIDLDNGMPQPKAELPITVSVLS